MQIISANTKGKGKKKSKHSLLISLLKDIWLNRPWARNQPLRVEPFTSLSKQVEHSKETWAAPTPTALPETSWGKGFLFKLWPKPPSARHFRPSSGHRGWFWELYSVLHPGLPAVEQTRRRVTPPARECLRMAEGLDSSLLRTHFTKPLLCTISVTPQRWGTILLSRDCMVFQGFPGVVHVET